MSFLFFLFLSACGSTSSATLPSEDADRWSSPPPMSGETPPADQADPEELLDFEDVETNEEDVETNEITAKRSEQERTFSCRFGEQSSFQKPDLAE